ADDATATWWNPAGLAHGPYFNSIIEFGKLQDPAVPTGASGEALSSWRMAARSVTAAYPAFGASYYRLRVSEIRAIGPTAGAPLDRQDQGPASVRLSSLLLQQHGPTAGWAAAEHAVLG